MKNDKAAAEIKVADSDDIEKIRKRLERVMRSAGEKARRWTAKHSPPIMHRSFKKIHLGTVYGGE